MGIEALEAMLMDMMDLEDYQEPRVYLTEIADLLIMAWTILDRNSRPCLQAIYSVLLLLFSNRKDSKQDLWLLFHRGSQIHEGNRGCRRTATATPNRDCGCSRGLQQLFDGDCYGDGPNHLIFVTRIKSGPSPKATITGQCMPVNNAVGAAPPFTQSLCASMF